VSIGEALATARDQAGLTAGEISAATRIRESIVRAIERDDFSGCGGDFYARGHIRAIARVAGIDPRPLIEEFDAARRAEQQAAEPEFEEPAPMPLREPRRPRDRRRINWTGVLAVLVVAAIGFAGYLLVSGGGSSGRSEVDAARSAHHRAGRPGQSPSPTPTASTPAPVVTKVRVIKAVSAAPFGPGGAGTGDNPQDASFAIDAAASTAWHTDWYATAEFGALKDGTGLLLDLGKPVAVTAARLALGDVSGASVQLRAGDTPVLAALKTVSQTSDGGGNLTMTVRSPVMARYLLVWFTKLPQDSAGTFMASVYSVRITAIPGRFDPGAG
jgi:cytoskeletal protein RodZ